MKAAGAGGLSIRNWLLAACFAIASASAALGPTVYELVERGRQRFLNEEELFSIVEVSGGNVHKLSFWEFDRLERTLPSEFGIGGWYLERRSVQINADRDVRLVARLAGKTMQVLGIVPVAGRGIEPEDDRIGSAPVAVVSSALAESLFGTSGGSLGRTITIDEKPFTVVGVLPEKTALPRRDVNVWIAARPGLSVIVASREVAVLEAVVRQSISQPSANATDAERNTGAFKPVLKTLEDFNRQAGVLELRPLRTVLDGGWSSRWRRIEVGLIAITILGISGCVVLILADMLRRVGEWRIRLTLGSSLFRFARDTGRPYLVTGLISSAFGCVVAVLVAHKVAVVSGLPDAGHSSLSVFGASLIPLIGIIAIVVTSALVVPATVLVLFPMRWERGSEGAPAQAGRFAFPLLGGHVVLVVAIVSGVAMLGIAEMSARRQAHTIGCKTCLSIDVRRGTAAVIGAEGEAISQRVRALADRFQSEQVHALISSNGPGDGISMREEIGAAGGSNPPPPIGIQLVEPADLGLLGVRFHDGLSKPEMREALKRGDVILSNLAAIRIFGARDPKGQYVRIRGWAHSARVAGVVSDMAQNGLFRPIPAIAYVPFSVNPVPDFSVTWDSVSATRSTVEELLRRSDPAAQLTPAVVPEQRSREGSGNIAILFVWMSVVAALSVTVLLGAAIGIAEVVFRAARRTLAIRELVGQNQMSAWFAVASAYLFAIAAGALIGLLATLKWIHAMVLPIAPISVFARYASAVATAVVAAAATAAVLTVPAFRHRTEDIANGLSA